MGPRVVADTNVFVSIFQFGDRDLLDLGVFRDTPIMTPRQFLDSGLWKR
jgi:predicted nucleic acid-binding protein